MIILSMHPTCTYSINTVRQSINIITLLVWPLGYVNTLGETIHLSYMGIVNILVSNSMKTKFKYTRYDTVMLTKCILLYIPP